MGFSEFGRFSHPWRSFLSILGLEVFTVLLPGADPPVSDKLPAFLTRLGKLEPNNGNSEEAAQKDGWICINLPPTLKTGGCPSGARLKMSENIPQATPRVCVCVCRACAAWNTKWDPAWKGREFRDDLEV